MKKQDICEVQATYKRKAKTLSQSIKSSQFAYNILKPFFMQDMTYKEHFYIILLNRANELIGVSKISEGGCSGTVADGKIIFQTALVSNAQGIILAHNHPGGQLKPSNADIELTEKMVKFGKMIDLPILDHIILTEETYYSFADNEKI